MYDHTNVPSLDVLGTVRSLLVDQVTSEVSAALCDREVPSILLKGPSIARWLYQDGTPRPYNDCDLLIKPDRLAAAQSVLRDLGFLDEKARLGHPRLESHGWTRGRDRIDVHITLIGIGAPPPVVWETMSSMTETHHVAGADVQVLQRTALALHIALHAAQHGRDDDKPKEDLLRALRAMPLEQWRDAADLAKRLRATDAFAVGLRLVPEGRDLASRLSLPLAGSADAALRADPVPLALGFEHLASTPGVGARLALLREELFPTPAFMRWSSPVARRGRLGLAASYCWRPLKLATQAIPGFLAWRRARRQMH